MALRLSWGTHGIATGKGLLQEWRLIPHCTSNRMVSAAHSIPASCRVLQVPLLWSISLTCNLWNSKKFTFIKNYFFTSVSLMHLCYDSSPCPIFSTWAQWSLLSCCWWLFSIFLCLLMLGGGVWSAFLHVFAVMQLLVDFLCCKHLCELLSQAATPAHRSHL